MKATQILIGKQFFWHGVPVFKVLTISATGTKYYRQYPDGTGEDMPMKSLLKTIKMGKFTCPLLTKENIQELTAGVVTDYDKLEKQADKIANYGRI